MSVRLHHLCKTYGKQKAVDDLSFEIQSGEIVGFLGPNGAGKSTTMKMLSCFIPPTSGDAFVDGISILKDSMAIRRLTGYLPEHNPLYGDMYVLEYLHFVASLHQLGSQAAKRIRDLIEMTGLGPERHKKIAQLSKGYKQRVGLAQAMMHDPKVLILDEPTSGLDPNQLVDIRQLIRELGKQKTLILSTHIMQEVQAVCSRVIIINKGKMVADDRTESLKQAASDRSMLRIEFKQKLRWEQLMTIKGVDSAEEEADKVWLVSGSTALDLRESVAEFAQQQALTLLRLEKVESSLEEVFKQMTK